MNALKFAGVVVLMLMLVAWDGSYAYQQPGALGAAINAVQKYRAVQIQSTDVRVGPVESQRSAMPPDPTLVNGDPWRLGRLAPLPEVSRLILGDADILRPPVGGWRLEMPLPLPIVYSRVGLCLERLAPVPEVSRLILGDGDILRPPVGGWKIEMPLPLPVVYDRAGMCLDRLAPLPELSRLILGDGDILRPPVGGWRLEMPLPLPVVY